MEKILNQICGIFTREKEVAKVTISNIDEEIVSLIKDTTTEKDITDKLNSILSAFKFSKFDVYDFKKTVEKLSPSIPQEKMLYTSILTTIADLGTTKEDIIQSIRYYSGMLFDFKNRTQVYVETTVKNLGDDVKSKVDSLNKQKEENKKAIERLLLNNSEIDAIITKVNNESQKYISDVKLVKDNVTRIVENNIQALKSEKVKCEKHLGK